MATFTIDAKDFYAGESQSDYLHDHGFSPDSYNLNLLNALGVLYFAYGTTDRGGATLTGNIVAAAYDKNYAGNDNYYVDDGGAFYTISGGTFTKRQTVVADTYSLGTSDMIQFKGNTYASGAGRVAQLTGSNLATVDSSWWTGLTSNVRHPLEVVEDKMYLGDLNVIYYFDGATSGIATTLPTDANITSLRRHPDGRHLIAFCGYTQDYSHTAGGPGKIYIVNKDTLQWEREIQIETQVEGSRNVGGVIYCTYGKKVGYFTGSGIKFLKRLATSGTTYSQSMGNMEDLLMVRDGTNMLMFGDLNGAGRRVWHNFYQGANAINVPIYKGNGLIMIGDSNKKLTELDYTAPSVSGGFYSKRYNFGSVVEIRRIDIIHTLSNPAGLTDFLVNFRDENNAVVMLKEVIYNSQSVSRTRIECNVLTDIFQLLVNPSNYAVGFKLFRIYYEPING